MQTKIHYFSYGVTILIIFMGVSPALALRGRAIRCKSSQANACCGLSAAIPHAFARVHIRYAHALGMRRVCVLARIVQRTEAIA